MLTFYIAVVKHCMLSILLKYDTTTTTNNNHDHNTNTNTKTNTNH